MRKRNQLRRLFELFTAGLSFKDFERLIKKDAPEVLDFYMQRISKPEKKRSKPISYIVFIRELFVAFLTKLAPVRRIFYVLTLVLFIGGYLNDDSGNMLLSFLILNVLLAFELADKLNAKDELDVARDIQESILPHEPPIVDGFDISCFYETAKEVGGDYFDFLKNEETGATSLIIGDISGKGMAAALYTIHVQAVFRLLKSFSSTKEILITLNNQLKSVFRSNSYFTASAAILHNDKSITYSRAGHLPLLFFRKDENSFNLVKPAGIGIGLRDHGLFDKTLEEIKIITRPGDIIVFYTDGVTECMDKEHNEYGEENLKKVVSRYSGGSANDLKSAILSSLNIFSTGADRHDDITFVIIKAR